MSSLWQDLRFAWRMLTKSPGFTCIAVLVLGLGIGANTAVFSVINAVLLRPLPYPDPDRLVVLRERFPSFPTGSVSLPDYLDWRAGQHTCTDLALTRRGSVNVSFPITNGAMPERVPAADVTANFFAVLGLHPALGRDLTDADDTPGASDVALISDAFWRRRFDANPGAIGQRLTVEGKPCEIIGVLPPEAGGFPRGTEIYVPLSNLRKDPSIIMRDNHPGFLVLGRIKPGVTQAQADADLNNIARELERRYPESNTGRSVSMVTLLDYNVGKYSASLYLLLGAVACVLLIACANVANLQLARAAGREKELAVRAALGASRWRLVRQMLTESALLGLLGGAMALLLALWASDAIVALSPAKASRFQEAHLDLTALAFTTAVALITGLAVGVWPAWRLSGAAAMAKALHECCARGGTGGAAQRRTRAVLVIAQVALAVVLLAGAGMALRGFWTVQSEPLGFRPDGILMMSVSLPESRYKKEKALLFFSQLLTRVRALPGVAAAATGCNVPFDDNDWESTLHITGTPPNPPGNGPEVEINLASPDYFKVMGIPILRGRDFDAREFALQPRAVIIDELLARRFFPGQDPLGQHIDDNQTEVKNPPPLTVVGVVGRTRNDAPGELPALTDMPQMHLAATQFDELNYSMLMIRVDGGDPLRLAEPVRREVLALDPELAVADITTMERNIAASLAPYRLTMVLLGTFAALALVLASIGIYGVMALSVTQRTRELGIRLALGAQRSAVLRLIMRQGAILVGAGLAAGLVAALAAGRLLASLLYGVGGGDMVMLGSVAAVLAGAALLACWLPARRATRVDPMVALRDE